MGRQPKPTHLRAVEGTRDRRSSAKQAAEPVPINPMGAPPPGMTDRESAVWNSIGRELPPGMLRVVDEYILTAFCRAVAIADEATELLRQPVKRFVQEGEDTGKLVADDAPPLLALTPNGFLQASAYLSIINRQAVLIKSLGAELGLSPAARTRIVVGDNGSKNDKNAHYFNR